MTYITSEGIQIPTVESLVTDIHAEMRSEIDPDLNTSPDDPIGEVTQIVASHQREAWESIRVSFNALDPDQAEGFLLDFLCAITGTRREPATPSRFRGARKLTLGLDANATVPKGTVFHVAGNPGVRFRTTKEVKSTSAGSYPAEAECEQTGPIACNAGTLTVIATPVVGLNSVTNPYDAEPGKLEDDDPELRERRERELRATGSGTVDALRADLLAYEDPDTGENPILEVMIYENDTDAFDSQGVPPHAIECIVYDGLAASVDNDTIAQLIWDSKPAGIRAYGSIQGYATDSMGVPRLIQFSRPTLRAFKVEITVEVDDPLSFPTQTIKDAILAESAEKVILYALGAYIRPTFFSTAADQVPGVRAVIQVRLTWFGSGFGSAWTPLQYFSRELPYLESSQITVITQL